MKLTKADCWSGAAVLAALGAMLLCFALRTGTGRPLEPLPYEPPAMVSEAADAGRINVNTAGLEELMSLSGIGEVRAQAILDDREANGPFERPEDLIRVKGIGEGILSNILDQITTGGEEDAKDSSG